MRPLLLLLCVWACPALADVRLTDDLGQSVQLEAPAQRVISLIPHAAEMLFQIQAQSKLVATVHFADYPDAARAIPRIGDYNAINTEAILRLEPDLILAYPSAPYRNQVDRLATLGIPVFFTDPQDFSAIAETLRKLGQLTGHHTEAEQAAADFESAIEALSAEYSERQTLRVFYEVWHQPIYTLNGDSYISAVLGLCGADNVFASLPVLSPQISLEAVFAADPDVIVSDAQDQWRQWSQLRAVAQDALIRADSDTLHRPTPSLLTGAAKLCSDLDDIRAARKEP